MWIIQAALAFLEWCGWVALAVFSLHQLWLVALCLRRRRAPEPGGPCRTWPVVTVQLPVFNERYVVGRILEAAARLDYPKDRLEIQVLDDSTDDTTRLVAEQAAQLRAQGYRIHHLHRAHRRGFKAGALAEGLACCRGEFLALFDADFVPPADFLHRTLPSFTDPSVGMVQTRWGHLNRDDSWLTRAQALMLDGHFLIEQVARSRAGRFFNFNGSAGVWRRQAIVEAGGWQPDTLAEDLDLSYRAQLAGWRFVYVPDVVVPGELPTGMASLKAQHHRWTKGSIQTALKLFPSVLRSREPWPIKIEACFHFGNWLTYPLGLLVSVLILPQLLMNRSFLATDSAHTAGGLVGMFLIATTLLFHLVAQRAAGRPWWRVVLDVPALMAVSIGLALNNSRAIWEALRGAPSVFHRTPKYNGHPVAAGAAPYRPQGVGAWPWAELALGLYTAFTLSYAACYHYYTVTPFLLLLSTGFWHAGLSSFAPDGSVPQARRTTSP